MTETPRNVRFRFAHTVAARTTNGTNGARGARVLFKCRESVTLAGAAQLCRPGDRDSKRPQQFVTWSAHLIVRRQNNPNCGWHQHTTRGDIL